jgi:hypothetical protein
MNQEQLEAIAATATPERVRQLVLELEPEQPEADRGTVPLFELLEAFSQAAPGIQPAEQSLLDGLLRRAIMAAVKPMGGMMFVEGDG